MDSVERPIIDYAKLPHLPREGIQTAGNNAWATRSLFLETAKPEHEQAAMWCLSEHEVLAHGRWYPSAWMCFIHATDEYDALRKICGNVKQWEAIKSFLEKYRIGMYDAWVAEQAYVQRSALRATLHTAALSLTPGYTAAAKMLLAMIDGPVKKGRPKKDEPKVEDKGIEEDAGRVLTFSR